MQTTLNLLVPKETVQEVLDKTLELEIYLNHWLKDQETPQPMKVRFVQKDFRSSRSKWLYEYTATEKNTIDHPIAFLLIILSENKQTELLLELICPKLSSVEIRYFFQKQHFKQIEANLWRHIASQSMHSKD